MIFIRSDLFQLNVLITSFLPQVKSLQPGLVGERPNTYTFTKSIAEALLAKEGELLDNSSVIQFDVDDVEWR